MPEAHLPDVSVDRVTVTVNTDHHTLIEKSRWEFRTNRAVWHLWVWSQPQTPDILTVYRNGML